MSGLLTTVLLILTVAGVYLHVLRASFNRQENPMQSELKVQRFTPPPAENPGPAEVEPRWVNLGAHAVWVTLGCTEAEQYAACEDIATAVLDAVLPVRDLEARR